LSLGWVITRWNHSVYPPWIGQIPGRSNLFFDHANTRSFRQGAVPFLPWDFYSRDFFACGRAIFSFLGRLPPFWSMYRRPFFFPPPFIFSSSLSRDIRFLGGTPFFGNLFFLFSFFFPLRLGPPPPPLLVQSHATSLRTGASFFRGVLPTWPSFFVDGLDRLPRFFFLFHHGFSPPPLAPFTPKQPVPLSPPHLDPSSGANGASSPARDEYRLLFSGAGSVSFAGSVFFSPVLCWAGLALYQKKSR